MTQHQQDSNNKPDEEPSSTAASQAAEVDQTADAADDPEAVRAALEEEIANLKDRLLRAMAETENIRKRAERERAEAAKYGVVPLVRDLLGVADNLGRALQAVPEEAENDETVKNLRDGVALTERELLQAFERHGVTRVDPKGEVFNPNFHQAVAEIPAPDAAAGTVVEVVQSGYVIGDRLVRAAMVVVAGGGAKKVDTEA